MNKDIFKRWIGINVGKQNTNKSRGMIFLYFILFWSLSTQRHKTQPFSQPHSVPSATVIPNERSGGTVQQSLWWHKLSFNEKGSIANENRKMFYDSSILKHSFSLASWKNLFCVLCFSFLHISEVLYLKLIKVDNVRFNCLQHEQSNFVRI